MFSELCDKFAGQPVVDFENKGYWKGPEITYRIRMEYDSEETIETQLEQLLAKPGSEKLTALIIGAWSEPFEGEGQDAVVAKLIECAPRLPGLRSLFLGEMTYEECEISWINQSDVSPLLEAYPKLEEFRVRGGTGLAFSPIRHESLRSLAIESGGLSRSVLRELFLCEFPELEHLELMLGEPNYGFDATVEDLQPLLAGKLHPKLKYLGLMNSDIANDIAAVVVNSPIVNQIDILDLSLGNLNSEGLRSLHALSSVENLMRLDISHFFASKEEANALAKVLKCEVIANDPQDADDEWRPIVHAE